MKSRVFTLVVGALIVVVLVLYLFSFQVRETQVAVVTTFGKPAIPITEAGLRFQWPWPIQSVKKFDRRLHVLETRLEETLTEDRQPIVISLGVGWRISDPKLFLEQTGTPEQAEKLVRQLVDHQSGVVGKYKLENFASTDPSKMKYADIEKDLVGPVTAQSKNYGFDVPVVWIRRLELPPGPTQAVYQRMNAERQKEARMFRSEGQGLANEIQGRANAERADILARAASEADRIRAEGDAEAAKYYETFNKYPELAIFLRKVKALRRALSERTTMIVDLRTEPFDLLQGGGGTVPTTGQPGKASEAPKGTESPRGKSEESAS